MKLDDIGVWYYKVIEGSPLSVWNIHFIPTLLQMACYGQTPCKSMHLTIRHPKFSRYIGADVVESVFYKVLSFSSDGSASVPFKKGTVALQGKSFLEEPIFAWLEFNLGKLVHDSGPENFRLMLAPLPFDAVGRPQLPYKDEKLEWFKTVARIVLGLRGKKDGAPGAFTGSELHQKLLERARVGAPEAKLDENVAYRWMNKLDALGLIVNIFRPGGIYEPTVNIEEFEKVFGIKL